MRARKADRKEMRRLAGALALALAAGAASGCASAFASLLPDPLLTPDGFPCRADAAGRVRRVPTPGPGGKPVHLAVEERGEGTRESLLVLIHGVFSDRRVWRLMAADLERDHDLLLVDLAGCGESDAPDPEALGPGGYSPESQARRVLEALRAALADRAPTTRLVLAGHSLGGAVVLRMLGDAGLRAEFADIVGRVERAVLVAPLDASFVQPAPGLRAVAEASGLEVDLGNLFGMVREGTAEAVLDGVADRSSALREDADQYAEILSDPARRRATQAMILAAVPLRPDLRPDWEGAARIEADYRRIAVPCLVVWGARDETLPCAMGYKLAVQLPDARLAVVERGMHGLPTERPWTCARLVRTFLEGEIGDLPASGAADPQLSDVRVVARVGP